MLYSDIIRETSTFCLFISTQLLTLRFLLICILTFAFVFLSCCFSVFRFAETENMFTVVKICICVDLVSCWFSLISSCERVSLSCFEAVHLGVKAQELARSLFLGLISYFHLCCSFKGQLTVGSCALSFRFCNWEIPLLLLGFTLYLEYCICYILVIMCFLYSHESKRVLLLQNLGIIGKLEILNIGTILWNMACSCSLQKDI